MDTIIKTTNLVFTSSMHRYLMSGLNVESDVALPARQQVSAETEFHVDVLMRQGDIPEQIEEATHWGPNWSASKQSFLLNLPEIGRFLATNGSQVTLSPAANIPVDDILVFATGTALAAILYQRGAMLLHGSAVYYNGRAFVFCGQSGAGKSTLAAALMCAGCELLADDISSIEFSKDGTPYVHSDGRLLRLFSDSIEHNGLKYAVGSSVRRQTAKFHVTPSCNADYPLRGVPLGAIYMLAESNSATPPGITELPLVTAAQSLLQQSYRRRLALAYSNEGRLVSQSSAIIARTKVYRLIRPRDFSKLKHTTEQLINHWDQLG